MKEIIFSQLSFPAGLNLDKLASVLPEKKFREFIVEYSMDKRKDRRIILPSHKTIKKIYFHYLWSLVKNGQMSWEEIRTDFKRNFVTLKRAGVSKKDIIKFYNQRRKEIIRDQEKKC